MKRSLCTILVCIMLFGLTSCQGVQEESSAEQSKQESQISDVILEPKSQISEEASYSKKIAKQADDIYGINTTYSQRYKDYIDKLYSTNYTLSYVDIYDNVDRKYKVVRNDDDWWYSVLVNGVKYEYFEKAGIGHYYDFDNKICVSIADTVKQIDEFLPLKDGLKFVGKEQRRYNGVDYEVDKFTLFNPIYTDDMQNLKSQDIGTAYVYYDENDDIFLIEYQYEDIKRTVAYDKIEDVDTSVFTIPSGYKEMAIDKYLDYAETLVTDTE